MSEQQQKDRLWVVGLIAVAAAAEVWATWLGLGSLAGFPVLRLGKIAIATSWTLSVGMEAYGGYAMWVWLAAAGGKRSRAFAMWSSLGAFVLSLIGQVAYHEMLARHAERAPSWLIGFVACLPVVVLGLAAILTHLMQHDRRAAEQAARRAAEAERKAAIERAEADERTALRAELAAVSEARDADVSALRDELDAERTARETAEAERAEAVAKAEIAARKLAAATGRKGTGNPGRKQSRKPASATGRQEPETTAPETGGAGSDLDAEALVLKYLSEGMSASAAGRKAGLSDSRGRQIARSLAKTAPTDAVDGGQDPE